MMIKQITFSPTGGTKKVADAIVKGMASEVELCELCNPIADVREITLNNDDLAIVAMPVYGGRIPGLAIERLKTFVKANGAKCVVVAVYGNRAYDDALLELYKTCLELNFNVIAAVAAIAEHSIIRKYGACRPDAEDAKELEAFGRRIKEAAKLDKTLPEKAISGNYPYKAAGNGPYPTAGKKCNACGLCAKQCPVGSIAPNDIRNVDKNLCISCMRCVSNCPNKARTIGWLMNHLIALAIKKGCAERKSNELFLC